MATILRELYRQLSSLSTEKHTELCMNFLMNFDKGSDENLARYFASALEENKDFSQIMCPFIPNGGRKKRGTNPVAGVMNKAQPRMIATSSTGPYEFTFLQREVPHLRARTRNEQPHKAWMDYVAVGSRPILGEIKWEDDQNSFYAFVQLLTYLSEMATPNQIARSLNHNLFGKDVVEITAFDLHIFLANFNDKGKKGPLIGHTYDLASAFKRTLRERHPEAATCLGDVLCMAGHLEEGSESFSKLSCLWMA